MRLLHTSDWHLGQSLLDTPRDYEHACFLAWLLDTLVAERIDALLITGDVFEHANPPPAAQRAYYEFLVACRQRLPRLDIVVIGGNHDSPGRLEAPATLLRAFGVTTIGGLPRHPDGTIASEQVLVPLHDQSGAIAAWVAAVPYLRRADLASFGSDLPDSRLSAAVRSVYAEVLELARARRTPDQALLATGHCYMVGGTTSTDSERRIQFGNQALPLDIFPRDVAYVALGHLHLSQRVLDNEHVRYAGSPIPLSLIEKDYRHQVLVIELAGAQLRAIREVPVPRAVDILVVPAVHAPLAQVLPLLRALPPAPEGAPAEARPFLEVRVTREGNSASLRQDIESALSESGAFARLLRISFPPREAGVVEALGDQSWATSLRELDPREVFQRCYRKSHPSIDEDQVPAPLQALFDELLEEAEHAAEPSAVAAHLTPPLAPPRAAEVAAAAPVAAPPVVVLPVVASPAEPVAALPVEPPLAPPAAQTTLPLFAAAARREVRG